MRKAINTDNGIVPTVLAGYYKFGTATLIGGGYGTTGASVIEVYAADVKA